MLLPSGETGEIILRAPQLMAGYFNNPEETARALRTHDGRGLLGRLNSGPWLHTGDLGYLDEDSYVFIVDRQKDLIKTSGYQVWPREVEEVLAMHPGVQEVGVAGVPDDLKGEVVKAWVVKRAGMNPSIDELRAHCREKLAPYKTPAFVEFRESLPKTMTGKVLRRALVAEHKAGRTSQIAGSRFSASERLPDLRALPDLRVSAVLQRPADRERLLEPDLLRMASDHRFHGPVRGAVDARGITGLRGARLETFHIQLGDTAAAEADLRSLHGRLL